jgi:peptidoglycan/LPS O-acetylase OafA/YrhL
VLPGGFIGVDVFFVISGFVVHGSLTSHTSTDIYDYFFGFYARRTKRLIPSLVTAVVASSTMAALAVPESTEHFRDSFRAGRYALWGSSNVFFAWQSLQGGGGYVDQMNGKDRAKASLFVHTWSLGVEEQFYVFFPLVVFMTHGHLVCATASERTSRCASMSHFIVLLGLSVAASGVMTLASSDLAFYTLPARFWELLSGAILAEVLTSGSRILPCEVSGTWGNVVAQLVIVLGLVWGFFYASPGSGLFPFPFAFLPVVSTVCFIASGEDCYMNKMLANQMPVYVGKMSYPLYLWHWPVLQLSQHTALADMSEGWRYLIQFGIMFALAAISYHGVEAWFRTWRPSAHWQPLVVSTLMVAAVALWLLALEGPLYGKLFCKVQPPNAAKIHIEKSPSGRYLAENNCMCNQVSEFSNQPPGARRDSASPSCYDTRITHPGSPWDPDDDCWASFAWCNKKHTEGCLNHGMCGWRKSQHGRECVTTSRNTTFVQMAGEVLRRHQCLAPEATKGRKPTVFLIGDSHAAMVADAVRYAVRGKFDVRQFTALWARTCFDKGYSSVLKHWRGELRRHGSDDPTVGQPCNQLKKTMSAYLQPADVVVLWYFTVDDKIVDHSNVMQKVTAEYKRFLIGWSALVAANNASLVVFEDHPFLRASPHDCTSTLFRPRPSGSPSHCYSSCEDAVDPYISREIRDFQNKHRSFLLFRPKQFFCHGEAHSPFIPGSDVIYYRDHHHLDIRGVRYLAPFICSFFQEHQLFAKADARHVGLIPNRSRRSNPGKLNDQKG